MSSGQQPSPRTPISVLTAADYSATDAGKYRLATMGAGVATRTGAGAFADGVMQDDKAAGQPVALHTGGILLVRVGAGGVTAGQDVASDANGQVVASTSTDIIVGVALEAVAANGLVRVKFGYRGVTA